MIARVAALFALSLVFVAGLLVADRYSVAQTAPAASAPADQAVAPVPQSAAPPAASAPPAAPAVSAPPEPTPAPVVTAPAEPAPAAPAPAPVVSAPLPPEKPALSLQDKVKGVAAKFLFASTKLPSIGKAMAIGYYPRGCLQGGVELPVDGPNWEVMRLSRNRNWGHPELVSFLKKFAPLAAKATGWHGILIGDMAQPRGGPLPFGHLSHQIGLDVDIWFMPKPDRVLTKEEREKISATNLVAAGGKEVDPKMWTPADAAFIRTAAEQPDVERVLVNAAIKKRLCEMEGKNNHSWMDKVRPWYGHDDHIHVRLKCPADSPNCRKQPPVPGGGGCAASDLAFWFSDKVLHPKPSPKPEKPRPGLTMADLPPACKTVLDAPAKTNNLASDQH
jgi:penicillin-insensitive murein DD-endopeptidase